jgi:hypothetical protein
MRGMVLRLGAGFLIGVALVPSAGAQTPQGTSFTYQGRLTEAGALASGPYDFQFVLYDAPVDGTQVGPTLALDDVVVTVGLFTVNLDFGSVFGGERRWLELGVRLGADTGPYTPILPRQELTPGPSAIFSVAAGDAQGLGGVPASQFVQTGDPRLSDPRVPLPGSPDYVQNGSVAQPGVSFNVGGTGGADVLDAATQFNLGGARILSKPGTHNLFAGVDAGASNTTGEANAFFGTEAGASNTTGGSNSFFGFNAGRTTTDSHDNSFFGDAAGFLNSGTGGSFFGFLAGLNNTTGSDNAFFGRFAGSNNTTGSNITLLGSGANVGAGGLSYATAIGSGAVVVSNNTVVLGRIFDAVQVPGALTVSGALGAPVFDAATQFNLGGSRVLGMLGTSNVYVGTGTGTASFGASNTFVGGNAGQNNTTGSNNSFFGADVGKLNTAGQNNSFFGSLAGRDNTASGNSFFGVFAGVFNTSGGSDSFFGAGAGNFNTTGVRNVFVGESAGSDNATGNDNTFVGRDADWGAVNPLGNENTLLGASTRVSSGISNATAIGSRAEVLQSNSIVLGSILGLNGGASNTNVGIGTVFPSARLHIVDNGGMLFGASSGCSGFVGMAFGSSISPSCQNYSIFGGDGSTYINRPGGGTISFREGNVAQVSIRSGGFLNLQALGGGGTVALCRNPTGDVSTCSSSLRYKTDVASFRGGLELVERLRPITFTWKANGKPDIGLAAEEVAEVDPLLAFRNAQGEIEGVNYSQLTVVLVNALKQQQREIDTLKTLVCQTNPEAAPCLQ